MKQESSEQKILRYGNELSMELRLLREKHRREEQELKRRYDLMIAEQLNRTTGDKAA